MKTYRPRRKRRSNLEVKKQNLLDIEHRLSSDVSTLILLMEQGTPQQVETAKMRATSDFHKKSDEMQKIAQNLGENYSRAVRDFLDSVDSILHSPPPPDPAKISHCYTMTQRLEKAIKAA